MAELTAGCLDDPRVSLVHSDVALQIAGKHNAWDAIAAGALGPLDVFVNGTQAVDNLQPTIRAATNAAAPNTYGS